MSHYFWSIFTLFAASAIAIPLAGDPSPYSPGPVPTSGEEHCVVKTVYVTPSTPSVVTVEIPLVWGTSATEDRHAENEAATPVENTPEATPEAPKAPETPEAPEAPKAPETPEAPKAPEAPEAPEAPKTPETPEAPKTPEATPEAPKAPEATPEAPKTPEATPEAPKAPEATPETPKAPETPQTPSGDSSSGSEKRSGKGTYYSPNPEGIAAYGACGYQNTEEEKVIALPTAMYEKSYCGRKVSIEYQGTIVVAEVVDRCPGCSGNHIDMSPATFTALGAQLTQGVIELTWWFN